MKIVLLIILVVLFGSFPLSVLGKIFDILGTACTWLGKSMNFFGWNGLI